MKNQEHSLLYNAYRNLVVEYKAYNERIIRTKFEMSKLWNYRNDFPRSWRDCADKLTADRKKVAILKRTIRETKSKMRQCDSEHPQN